jgi:hypothetical protein
MPLTGLCNGYGDARREQQPRRKYEQPHQTGESPGQRLQKQATIQGRDLLSSRVGYTSIQPESEPNLPAMIGEGPLFGSDYEGAYHCLVAKDGRRLDPGSYFSPRNDSVGVAKQQYGSTTTRCLCKLVIVLLDGNWHANLGCYGSI